MFKITLDSGAAEKLENLGLLILRVGTGGMLMVHGWGKLSGYSSMAGHFPDPLGVSSHVSLALAIFGEFFCSALVALGIVTRLATIPILITMGVAVLMIHGSDPWAKKEPAMLYLIPALTILFVGPGKWTLGSIIRKKR